MHTKISRCRDRRDTLLFPLVALLPLPILHLPQLLLLTFISTSPSPYPTIGMHCRR